MVLSDPVHATVAAGTGVVVIGANDRVRVAQPRISVGPDVVVGEGSGFVDLPVTLSAPGKSVVSVAVTVFNGTAVAGQDYTCPFAGCGAGTLTFAPGETVKTVRVPILDDSVPEGMETFTMVASNPVNATIVRSTLKVTIKDND